MVYYGNIILVSLLQQALVIQGIIELYPFGGVMLVVSVESLAQSMLLNHGPGPRGLYDKSIPSFNNYNSIKWLVHSCKFCTYIQNDF